LRNTVEDKKVMGSKTKGIACRPPQRGALVKGKVFADIKVEPIACLRLPQISDNAKRAATPWPNLAKSC